MSFISDNQIKTSAEYFAKNKNNIGPGSARSVAELFRDHTSEKDFWSKWVHILVDSTGPDFADQWSDMTLEIMHKANSQWGVSRFPSGLFLEGERTKVVMKMCSDNGEYIRSLSGWSEQSLPRLNKGITTGKNVFPDHYFYACDRLMVLSDYITLIETDKTWQSKSVNSLYKLIPDFWFFRVVECLAWVDDGQETPGSGEVFKTNLYIDPSWGWEDLVREGYATETRSKNS